MGRTAFGRPFDGSEITGLRAGEQYYLSIAAWGMGDHDSVDVAQICHEHVRIQLKYGHPLSKGDMYEGLHINDHLIVHCDRNMS